MGGGGGKYTCPLLTQHFATKEKENEVRAHIQMEVMMCVSWNGKEVSIYGRLKSGFVYYLVPRTYCEFKISNLFSFSQSYTDTLHDNLEGNFIEINF